MTTLLRPVDALLRGTRPPRSTSGELVAWALWLCVAGCLYGAVMGSFGGGRLWQVVFSAVKVPLLLWITFALTLPSFFVLNSLLGLRDDFPEVMRALLRTQSASAVLLAALTPYTALWYLSSNNYDEAVLFNALMFGIASVAAQVLLARAYRPLVVRHPHHRALLRGWIAVYAFVGIQMGWVLRPFIGDPARPTRFFREGAWGNAYLAVGENIVTVIRGWLD